jgi:hypothetical protein
MAREMARQNNREEQLADAARQIYTADFFILTPKASSEAGKEPAFCGVIQMAPDALEELRDVMADQGERVKAGDAFAYRVALEQRTPLGFSLPGSGARKGAVFMAPAGPEAVAVATTQRAFRALAEAVSGQAVSADAQALGEMVQAAGGAPFWIAIAARPTVEAFGTRMADAPEAVRTARGCLLAVDVTEEISVQGLLRLASEGLAAETLAQAQAGLESMRAGLAEGSAPSEVPVAAGAAILNRVSLSADGPDVRASMVLTQEDLQQMIGLVLMSALAAGMQQQGPQ